MKGPSSLFFQNSTEFGKKQNNPNHFGISYGRRNHHSLQTISVPTDSEKEIPQCWNATTNRTRVAKKTIRFAECPSAQTGSVVRRSHRKHDLLWKMSSRKRSVIIQSQTQRKVKCLPFLPASMLARSPWSIPPNRNGKISSPLEKPSERERFSKNSTSPSWARPFWADEGSVQSI